MASTFDVSAVRRHFPALLPGGPNPQIYFDNAGGSQVLQEVIDAIVSYLSSNNVQLGASYPISQASTKLFEEGCAATAKYINASPDEVVLGPSTTQLFRNLSISLYDYIQPSDEIIASKLDHEANVASWLQLAADRKATLKWYVPTDKQNPHVEPDVLRQLMSSKTKFVAFTQTSNILGTINDVRAIAEVVHEVPGALLCVDAVAYAPHRAIDVHAWGVDFYSFSWYKVYGPHISALYASRAAQKHLRTLGHFFKPTDGLENLLGLAAANYELTASIPAVCRYLEAVPWEQIAAHEERLQGALIEYLNTRPDVYRIWGEPVADRNKRVPVISFTVKDRSSRDIVEAIEAVSEYGCRWGSFYSNRLAEEVLGLSAADGVVRVSLVHYNTLSEIEGFIKVLDEVVFA